MKLTIVSALVELKRLDQRINKSIDQLEPVALVKGKDRIPASQNLQNISEENFKKHAKGDYQSIHDLIKRRASIKQAISLSNAKTKVEINEEEMTVLEVIETKNVVIPYKKELKQRLEHLYASAISNLEKFNQEVDQKLQQILMVSLGKEQQDSNAIKTISEPFLEMHQLEMIDPLKAKEEFLKLQNEIDDFEADIDVVLTTSNAITTIEVED